MTSITPFERASLAEGLRALADHLESAAAFPRCAEILLLPVIAQDGIEHAVACVNSAPAAQSTVDGATAVQRDSGPVMCKIILSPRLLLSDRER